MSNGTPPPAPSVNVTAIVIGSAIGTLVGTVVGAVLNHVAQAASHTPQQTRSSVARWNRRHGR